MKIRIGLTFLTTLIWAASPPVRAQFVEDCPGLTPAIEDLLGAVQTLCTGDTQGVVSDPGSAGTLLVDEQHRFRGFIARRDGRARVYQGALAHDGSVDDVIFWGTWTQGTLTEFEDGRVSREENRWARPFVAGVDPGFFFRQDVFSGRVRSPMPTSGVHDYRLLGRPAIISEENAVYVQSDRLGQPIDPGPIEAATVRVDLGNGTGMAEITFVVRGIRSQLRIPLARRTRVGSFAENIGDEVLPHHAPAATVRFYGRQGEFMGLEFRVPYQGLASQDAFVQANMPNARGRALIALRRVAGAR